MFPAASAASFPTSQWCQKRDMADEIEQLVDQVEKLQARLGGAKRRKERDQRISDAPGVGRTERYSYPVSPDGASAPRPRLSQPEEVIPPLGDGGDGGGDGCGAQMTTETRLVRLPHYNGSGAWELYEAQLHLAARSYHWSQEVTARHLGLALEGEALKVLLDLPSEKHGDLNALKTALQRRFGKVPAASVQRRLLRERRRERGETLGVLTADLLTLVQQAYPSFPGEVQQQLALDAFLEALRPEALQRHVQLAAPASLEDALKEAERAEIILVQRPFAHTQVARCVAAEEDIAKVMVEGECSQRIKAVCWRCRKRGHLARDCLAPSPAGNDGGGDL